LAVSHSSQDVASLTTRGFAVFVPRSGLHSTDVVAIYSVNWQFACWDFNKLRRVGFENADGCEGFGEILGHERLCKDRPQ